MELNDLYDHNDSNLIYITESIPTQDTQEEFNEQFVAGCKCKDLCIKDKCPCVINSGASYTTDYLQNKDLQMENIQNVYVINVKDCNKPIYECNSNCACTNSMCGNRLVQFGARKYLKIISCDSYNAVNNMATKSDGHQKGYGLITTKAVKQGNFICEYAGEIITKKEAMKRHETNEQQMLMNYIFCINEHFGGNKCKSTYIDPSRFGNIGRYLNHSCQPNCEIIPIRINNTIPKLCIFAAQAIKENEELTFDYGNDNINPFKTVCSQKAIKCLCQSIKCRQYLPFSEYTVL